MAKERRNKELLYQSQTAAMIWLGLAVFLALLLLLSYIFTRKGKKGKPEKPVGEQAVPGPVPNNQVRRRRGMRVNRRPDGDNFEEDLDDDFDDEVYIEDKDGKKVGAKKLRKLELKAEKRAERQAELEEREERKQREARLVEERKKEDELRKLHEAEQAEVERQRKEELERKEHEEYLKLKAEFTVDESGEVGILSENESQGLLQRFVDHVKTSKVVLLEELAAQFDLKVQEAIDRLQNLQEMGLLTGVMDDRGKFIYISEDELQNVAKFIRQRGRIPIVELAECSNTLIRMQGASLETAA